MSAAVLVPGTTVAGYRVDGVVGQGGMGVVYEATQLSLERTVALKLLAVELTDDAAFRARFRREGRMQATLDHPHIIPVYEAGESAHGLFLAMRMVRGLDLRRLIRSGTLDERRALAILAQVADALDAAHHVGLIHRDIKPSNVLVARRDHAFLADFGLTKSAGADTLTGTGQFVGTLNYIAPELLRGEGASSASDVYAMGALLYECMCGKVPFPRDTEAAVIYAHLQEAPPSPSATLPRLPAALDGVIERAMSKDPGRRHTTALALMDDAARAFGAPPARTGTPRPPNFDAARTPPPRSDPDADTPSVPPGLRATAGARRPAVVGRRASPRALVAGGAAALALVAATFMAGHATASEQAHVGSAAMPRTATPLRSAAVAVEVPERWRPAPRARVPGLSLAGRVASAPPAPAHAALVAGRAEAPNFTLVPAGLLARQRRPLPAPRRVALGGLEALAYERLRIRGLRGLATVYAVPTRSGVATVACTGPSGASSVALAACARVATTLRVVDDRPFGLAPRTAYAHRLAMAIGALNRTRTSARERLRSAPDAGLQALAAEDLAGAYKAARRALAAVLVSPQEKAAHAAVLSALGLARDAHLRLAATARAQDPGGYAAAERDVGRAESLVASSLRGLRPLGYHAR